MTSLFRSIFWFEPGALSEIRDKVFRVGKPGYGAQWESIVLFTLLVGLCVSFVANIYLGLVYLWFLNPAFRRLIRKSFLIRCHSLPNPPQNKSQKDVRNQR
jgi:hypothetical protein